MPPSDPVPSDIDVAFTFLGQDEELALELARLLRASVSTFVYSERQKELAGTDGVAQFSNVYEERARFVVVLYRKGYGTTKWTRIEEAAVTSRGVNLGWDSLLLISMDGTKPTWLPASRLWYGISKFGARTASEVILARFQDLFQPGRPQSLVEHAKGISRHIASKEEADRWQQSEAAVKVAEEEVTNLRRLLQEQVPAINEAAPNVRLSFIPPDHNGVFGVRAGSKRVTFGWQNQYSNTLRHAYLFVQETELTDSAFDRIFEPTREVHMRLTGPDPRLWIADEEPNRSFSTPELMDWHIRKLLPEQ